MQVDSKGTVYVSDRENNRILIFAAEGKFLRMWTHLGSTQNLFITPNDELWMITHRENVAAGALDTLGGRIFRVDIATGKILGLIESPGHWNPCDAGSSHIYRELDRQRVALVPRLAQPIRPERSTPPLVYPQIDLPMKRAWLR